MSALSTMSATSALTPFDLDPAAGTDSQVLVLGIGNLLWADEGFGVRCAETLHRDWRLPAGVAVMDGGTQGMYLLPYIQGARRLLVFDAVDYGLQPGEVKVVRDDEVPRFMGAKKMSLHQTGFQEVLAAAAFTGQLPDTMVLIGVQPEDLADYGGSLRPLIQARIPAAIDAAVAQLAAWGFAPERRPEPLAETLADASLDQSIYEAGRPDETLAWRLGDPRFLNRRDEIAGAAGDVGAANVQGAA
ncbi:HyaD/HybD family hydrogenase maturation endopeptidase [Oryzomicrobium sp.]|uniref:HyaD/HybD family hydrogenase maturation endopeptidase n=1 Tax=Oryzomicrobium sp. TaxID=1911578 RepID=UPI0025F6DB47|nr:HyaD/HybD family hydrogenase maturation endopeptidase [Oryzomicrobium sp.]MCE1244888.1 HyaD/HybD family hydrogenase maturation endopeptidase [Oryzomicrobium sp.]